MIREIYSIQSNTNHTSVNRIIFSCFLSMASARMTRLKGQCHEIFDSFIHESNPSWPLINRLKWFFFKIRFHKDIQKNLPSQPFQKLSKYVGLCCNSSHIFLKFCSFSFKERRGLKRQNGSWQNSAQADTAHTQSDSPQAYTAQSSTRAVLVTFGSTKKKFDCQLRAVLACAKSDSTQCQPILDLRKIFEIFQNIIKWILNSLHMEIVKNQKNLFGSAQCQPAQTPLYAVLAFTDSTLRSVSQFWICKHFNF